MGSTQCSKECINNILSNVNDEEVTAFTFPENTPITKKYLCGRQNIIINPKAKDINNVAEIITEKEVEDKEFINNSFSSENNKLKYKEQNKKNIDENQIQNEKQENDELNIINPNQQQKEDITNNDINSQILKNKEPSVEINNFAVTNNNPEIKKSPNEKYNSQSLKNNENKIEDNNSIVANNNPEITKQNVENLNSQLLMNNFRPKENNNFNFSDYNPEILKSSQENINFIEDNVLPKITNPEIKKTISNSPDIDININVDEQSSQNEYTETKINNNNYQNIQNNEASDENNDLNAIYLNSKKKLNNAQPDYSNININNKNSDIADHFFSNENLANQDIENEAPKYNILDNLKNNEMSNDEANINNENIKNEQEIIENYNISNYVEEQQKSDINDIKVKAIPIEINNEGDNDINQIFHKSDDFSNINIIQDYKPLYHHSSIEQTENSNLNSPETFDLNKYNNLKTEIIDTNEGQITNLNFIQNNIPSLVNIDMIQKIKNEESKKEMGLNDIDLKNEENMGINDSTLINKENYKINNDLFDSIEIKNLNQDINSTENEFIEKNVNNFQDLTTSQLNELKNNNNLMETKNSPNISILNTTTTKNTYTTNIQEEDDFGHIYDNHDSIEINNYEQTSTNTKIDILDNLNSKIENNEIVHVSSPTEKEGHPESPTKELLNENAINELTQITTQTPKNELPNLKNLSKSDVNLTPFKSKIINTNVYKRTNFYYTNVKSFH